MAIDGSGKTFSGSLLGLTLCFKYPGIVGLVGAQTYGLLKDTTFATYIEHLDNLGIQYTYLKKENEISFSNGSKLLFRHLEEPDKLKSLNLGFVEIEEMSDVPHDTFLVLLSRLRQKPKPEWTNFKHRLFGHTNPQGGRGWIYEEFVKNKKDGFRRIIAPSTQNPHLPKGYIEMLRSSYNEDYFNMMVMGLDDNSISPLVTKGFDKDVQVIPIEINPQFPIHLTCDFNVDPMCWYISQHYDGNVYYIDEIVMNNASTDRAAQLVCDVLKDYKNHMIIVNGDASGNNMTTKGNDYIFIRNAFQRNGFNKVDVRVMHHNPKIEWRLSCWNNMIIGPDREHHIFISPECRWLLYNIENLEINPGTSKPKLPTARMLARDPNAKYLGHPIDAASYLICLYYPVKKIDYKDTKVVDELRRDVFNGKYNNRII